MLRDYIHPNILPRIEAQIMPEHEVGVVTETHSDYYGKVITRNVALIYIGTDGFSDWWEDNSPNNVCGYYNIKTYKVDDLEVYMVVSIALARDNKNYDSRGTRFHEIMDTVVTPKKKYKLPVSVTDKTYNKWISATSIVAHYDLEG